MPIRLGYFKIGSLPVRSLTIITGGILGKLSDSAAVGVAERLLGSLTDAEAERVCLKNIRTDSPLAGALRHCAPRLRQNWIQIHTPHRRMGIPRDPALLWGKMKSKHRGWIKRNIRKLDQLHGGQVRFACLTREDDVPAICQYADGIAAQTYQRGLGAGFRDCPEQRLRLRLAASHSGLKSYFLFVRERPVAFWIGTVMKRVFFSAYTGYDPAFRNLEVGTTLLLHLLEQLSAEGLAEFDFGLGDAPYKQRFADEYWLETDISVYAARPRPLGVGTVLEAACCLNYGLKGALQRAGRLGKLKRWWRGRLAS